MPLNGSSSHSLFSQAVQAIEQFGEVIEELLLKHGKRIIGEKYASRSRTSFFSLLSLWSGFVWQKKIY